MAMPNAKVQMPNVVAGTALIIRYSAFALPNSVCAVNSGYALADTNRMRIALDARTIYRMVRRGTGKNLIDLYRTIARMRPDWHVIAYHRTPEGGDELFGVLDEPNIEPRQIEMPGDRIHAWGRWRLPMAAWRDGADLLHCPANLCPTWMPVPTLVTIHDLIPLDMPDGRPGGDLRLFEQSVKTACRRAAGIVTPSAYTRDRLVSEFGGDADRITVNHWAPDRSVSLVEGAQHSPALQHYGIDKPFALHFGAPAPRKNTRRVIESWAMIGSKARQRYQLLIVGLDGDSLAKAQQRVDNLGITDSVRLHGFADEADLPTLLSAARVLMYPSLSEGFGLPILDAWKTGAAVLTSDTTSLPEVAGDGAVLVDPTDPRQIALQTLRLLRDVALRRHLATVGHQRVQAFTWQATATRFIAAAERAAGVEGNALRMAA
jgi:glycosyltransferase involved in cell wall biosynthesis